MKITNTEELRAELDKFSTEQERDKCKCGEVWYGFMGWFQKYENRENKGKGHISFSYSY